MFVIFLWLIQDFITVFTGGSARIPGLFILGLVYKIIDDTSDDDRLSAIWTAFAGGLLWDLRWVGLPGFFTLGYVIVILIVIQVWGLIPPQNRNSGTGIIIFILLEISQLVPPLVPVLILGGTTGWQFFISQQLYALPAICFCMYLFSRKHTK